MKRALVKAFAALPAIASLAALPGAATAQEPVFQRSHADWNVFVRGEGEERVCYAVSEPTDKRPANVDHGDIFFLVSTWPEAGADEQPSFAAGYPLQPDEAPRVRVGSWRYDMFVSQTQGFVEDADEESSLVRAMKRGYTMRVEAMSTRGTRTVYEFSLSGVTAALEQVEDLCR